MMAMDSNITQTLLSVADLQKSYQKFGIADYIVFVLMLVGCSAVGLYYALIGKKQGGDEAAEYLMGGRQMQVFPISMSLVASFISGITLLGLPTEIYLHGIDYMFVAMGYTTTGFLASYFVLPVFHNLKLSSTYEYLHLRFDYKVRLLSSILFSLSLICWLPIVIYVPALAFNQVTGVNVHIITPCVCLVCIFYTCIGGLKAVVWTDVIQTFLMIGAMIIILVKGTLDIGGLEVVWKRSWESGRLKIPPLSLDPTIQFTIFSVWIGAAIHFIQTAIMNQNMIQRFLTLPTLPLAKRALWFYILGICFFTATCSYCGLLAFATYHDCDPLSTGLAKAKDQVVPLLVMRVLGDFPGLPGLFVAGVFSAALSSLSTGLNSMAAVVLEDFVKSTRKTELSQKATIYVLKGVVVGFGILCVGLVFVVEKLGTVLQLSMSLSAVTAGSSLGIFASGMLLPVVNAKGALWGGIIGLAVNTVIVMGNQKAQATGALNIPNKPLYTYGCDYQFEPKISYVFNATMAEDASSIFPLYRLSFLWYTTLGALSTIAFAVIISYATGGNDKKTMNPDCFCPVIRRWLPRRTSIYTHPEDKELLGLLKNNEKLYQKNTEAVRMG